MANNNDAAAEVRGDYTIAELRGMLAGEEKAAPAEKSESEPASGTEKKTAGAERGDDGKFKTSEKKGEPSKEEKSDAEDGPQKRINKAIRAQREAERKAEQLQRENEELKKSGSKTEPKKEAPKAKAADEPKKPVAADFTSYEEYVEALTDYKVELREREREKKDTERKQAEAQAAHKKVWDAKVEAAREKHSDYDDVMAEAGDTPISQSMHNAIAESDIGPQLAYYLATHLDEAKEIAGMSPTRATRAMLRIEDTLADAAAETKAATAVDKKPAADTKKRDLPKPPRNVGGVASPKEPKLDDPDLSMTEFKRIARAHLTRS